MMSPRRRPMSASAAREGRLSPGTAAMPLLERVAVGVGDVRRREGVRVGVERVAVGLVVGEDHALGAERRDVGALLDPAGAAAVADHDLAA